MKKMLATAVAIILTMTSAVNTFALTDTKVFTDPVSNTYVGRLEAPSMIQNLKFSDVSSNYWAKESITRAGALDMIKGYDRKFNPTSTVSNQEVLAFALRVMGLEQQAQAEGVRLQNQITSTSILPIWSLGYLSLARQNGLITAADFNDALRPDQSAVPAGGFLKEAPATREQTATWLVQAIDYLYAQNGGTGTSAFNRNLSQQKIYNFSDWKNISADHATDVELITANGIMVGDSNGNFNPQGSITRAEMAQILSNMDSIYNESAGLTKVYGTVGGIRDVQSTETGKADMWRNIYIRNENGDVDILQYQLESTSSPQANNRDAVVYNNGFVGGMSNLQVGDKIEYLINPTNNEIYFIKNVGGVQVKNINGILEEFDFTNGQLHITDASGKRFIYSVADGLYGNDGTTDDTRYVYLKEKKVYYKDLPIGSKFDVELKNEIVTQMVYNGEPTVVNEMRGIVVENNPGLGYLTFIDNDGNEVTKNYYANDLVVEKQQYYDTQDEIGYIDQIFPNFQYDPRDTSIEDIEAGDIVFVQLYDNDSSTIEKISASTNYTMKYGKLRQMTSDGDMSQILIEYEDGQTSWFDVASSVFVSRNGSPMNITQMQAGDWIKVLVNQAIISPGYVMESVKEIAVEGAGHDISSVVKGQLGAIDQIQKKISIQNAYTLAHNGWSDYKEIRQLSIDNNDISYYYEGKRISLDYAMQFLKRADGEVYIALENNYAGERVSMVSFRNGRGDISDTDTVVNSDGVGGFSTINSGGNITTDDGTIVIRNGRLTTGNNIMVPDYAQVELNGGSNAAVVSIYDRPSVSSLLIARGRILSVDEGKSFKVRAMSQLNDMTWVYTPVEREFVIDNSTIFMDDTGVVSRDTFIDYTSDSVVNEVYNIIYEGTKATHVIKAPYPKEGVRGQVYSVASDSIGIKDSSYYNDNNGAWNDVSNKDTSVNVATASNTIVIKNNKVVSLNQISVGDKVKVYAEELPDKIEGGMTVNGYIIMVEN